MVFRAVASVTVVLGLLVVGCASSPTAPPKQAVVRHPLPGSDFPILLGATVPGTATLVFMSGVVPVPADPNAEAGSRAYWGDTEAQTLSALGRLDERLHGLGYSMSQVVKMQAFLVGDPELGGRMDFDGFMRGYRRFFGTTEQPNLPARSAFQIAGLVRPGMLVEIEVTLAVE